MAEKAVILSSPILLNDGIYTRDTITLEHAQRLLQAYDFENFNAHQSTKILGVEPARERRTCYGFDIALCVKPLSRLEQREYSVAELQAVGYEIVLIGKVTRNWLNREDE